MLLDFGGISRYIIWAKPARVKRRTSIVLRNLGMRTAGRSLAAFCGGALVRQDGGRIQHDPGGVSHRGAGQRVLESREWRLVLRRASPHNLSGDFGCVPPASILDCEQDWNVWHPEYDKKLGPPTANATVDGAKYLLRTIMIATYPHSS